MLPLDTLSYIIVGLCAMLVGFSKTGLPGAGILVVPLLASVMPARQSVGFLLPMLCVADIMAVIYWRRHADWPKLLRLMPWATVGIFVGFFLLGRINDHQLMPIIGVVILVLITITTWRNKTGSKTHIPTHWCFAAVMGLLAGTITMLANAAGPIMAIYLLAMRLDKKEFLGTGAWYFFIMNIVKLPFSHHLELITAESLLTNLAMIPLIILGGVLAILLVHRIPDKVFNAAVTTLATLAAGTLTIRGIIQLASS